jgi:hypothetical protein
MTSVKPPDGFVPYYCPYGTQLSHQPPQLYAGIEIWRHGWLEPVVVEPRTLHPAMNVAGLYWRPIRKGDETVN